MDMFHAIKHGAWMVLCLFFQTSLAQQCGNGAPNNNQRGNELAMAHFANRALVQDPRAAAIFVSTSWRQFQLDVSQRNIIKQDDDEARMRFENAKKLAGGQAVRDTMVYVPREQVHTDQELVTQNERGCPFFALSDQRLHLFNWENKPEAMSHFVAYAAAAISRTVARAMEQEARDALNPAPKQNRWSKGYHVNVASLGSDGFLIDLAVLGRVLNEHPHARINFVYKGVDAACHHQCARNLDKEAQTLLHSQFLRWFKTYYPHNTDILFQNVNGKDLSNHNCDVVYARNTLGAHRADVETDFKTLCDSSMGNALHFSGILMHVAHNNKVRFHKVEVNTEHDGFDGMGGNGNANPPAYQEEQRALSVQRGVQGQVPGANGLEPMRDDVPAFVAPGYRSLPMAPARVDNAGVATAHHNFAQMFNKNMLQDQDKK